jgi:hypothetical protein
MNEKQLRFKYIRVLEKFVKRAISLLKDDSFDFKSFKEKIDENYKAFDGVEAVRLDSQYMVKLQNYANKILNSSSISQEEYENYRELLLKEANLLHKEKNRSNYKKDKHKKAKYNDGY